MRYGLCLGLLIVVLGLCGCSSQEEKRGVEVKLLTQNASCETYVIRNSGESPGLTDDELADGIAKAAKDRPYTVSLKTNRNAEVRAALVTVKK